MVDIGGLDVKVFDSYCVVVQMLRALRAVTMLAQLDKSPKEVGMFRVV
jgi:hypothetical protein